MDSSRATSSPSSRGIALVQVMVFSMLLLLLATGLMRMMFGTHSMVNRMRQSDMDHSYIDACKARLDAIWDGTPCNGTTQCTFFGGGPTVNASCAGSRVTFTIVWP